MISLSWVAKKKEAKNSPNLCLVWVTMLLWQIMGITGYNLLKFVALIPAQKQP
jgi:hypothetical protein